MGNATLPLNVLSTTIQNGLNAQMPTGGTALASTASITVRTLDGVTYYTHNRVMLRYAGVDGIKTGFIGASGR